MQFGIFVRYHVDWVLLVNWDEHVLVYWMPILYDCVIIYFIQYFVIIVIYFVTIVIVIVFITAIEYGLYFIMRYDQM